MRPGRLRVCVHGPRPGQLVTIDDLRVLLTADVLTRVAEFGGVQVDSALLGPADGAGGAALDDWTTALGIYPSSSRPWNHHLNGSRPDVHVAGSSAVAGWVADGVWVRVAPVHGVGADEGAPRADDVLIRVSDPLALRVLLLSSPYRDPVTVSDAALVAADEVVQRWRRRVAEWAEAPSRPIPNELLTAAFRSVDDDLDTAAVLTYLRDLEADPAVPAGAKFETFVHLDRLLGLDLPRDIGRVPNSASTSTAPRTDRETLC
jgi:hypothetical protein